MSLDVVDWLRRLRLEFAYVERWERGKPPWAFAVTS